GGPDPPAGLDLRLVQGAPGGGERGVRAGAGGRPPGPHHPAGHGTARRPPRSAPGSDDHPPVPAGAVPGGAGPEPGTPAPGGGEGGLHRPCQGGWSLWPALTGPPSAEGPPAPPSTGRASPRL